MRLRAKSRMTSSSNSRISTICRCRRSSASSDSEGLTALCYAHHGAGPAERERSWSRAPQTASARRWPSACAPTAAWWSGSTWSRARPRRRCVVDVADIDGHERLIESIAEEHGRIWGLVNVAGIVDAGADRSPDRRRVPAPAGGDARRADLAHPRGGTAHGRTRRRPDREHHLDPRPEQRARCASPTTPPRAGSRRPRARSRSSSARPGVLVNSVAPGFVRTRMSIVNGQSELDTDWFREGYVEERPAATRACGRARRDRAGRVVPALAREHLRERSADRRRRRADRGVLSRVAATAVAHTGLTVSDLDASLAFWRDGLGMHEASARRSRAATSRPSCGEPGAHVRMVQLEFPGGGTRIELFQYLHPRGGRRVGPARRCRIRPRLHRLHRCRRVDGAARRGGRHAFGEPADIDTGANRGGRCVYIRDPDGHMVELFSPPKAAG